MKQNELVSSNVHAFAYVFAEAKTTLGDKFTKEVEQIIDENEQYLTKVGSFYFAREKEYDIDFNCIIVVLSGGFIDITERGQGEYGFSPELFVAGDVIFPDTIAGALRSLKNTKFIVLRGNRNWWAQTLEQKALVLHFKETYYARIKSRFLDFKFKNRVEAIKNVPTDLIMKMSYKTAMTYLGTTRRFGKEYLVSIIKENI